jgi:catechol 2,3-dioxygenase-like lactoylglutathione lyase family enzyme
LDQGTITPLQRADRPIDPGVRIGHVHLRTADIDRVRAFYVGVLGFDVVAEARDVPGWGTTGDLLLSQPAATTTTSGSTPGSPERAIRSRTQSRPRLDAQLGAATDHPAAVAAGVLRAS